MAAVGKAVVPTMSVAAAVRERSAVAPTNVMREVAAESVTTEPMSAVEAESATNAAATAKSAALGEVVASVTAMTAFRAMAPMGEVAARAPLPHVMSGSHVMPA
jgi:hypothetical protein